MPKEIEIVLPLPPKEMHPNARKHWRAKLDAKKRQRQDARLAVVAKLGTHQPPQWSLAEVECTWYLARRNDPDNLLAWLKATWDGIADAGVVSNDRGFVFLPPTQVVGKETRGRRGLVIRIRERVA